MEYKIRKMLESDIQILYKSFQNQGWEKPLGLFKIYYQEQTLHKRQVYVAAGDQTVFGYASLIERSEAGPFMSEKIPMICDFNVFIPYQKKGIGTALLDAIEEDVRKYSDQICLGVGLHSGYGPAQRLYIKRGYIPDGSGIWYNDKILTPYHTCVNDDDLILYLCKNLK